MMGETLTNIKMLFVELQKYSPKFLIIYKKLENIFLPMEYTIKL